MENSDADKSHTDSNLEESKHGGYLDPPLGGSDEKMSMMEEEENEEDQSHESSSEV